MQKLLRISYLKRKTHDWVRSEIDFLVGLLGNSPGNSGISHAMTASPKPSFGGTLDGGSAEDMLDGPHQRVDIPAYARTAHKGLLQKTGRGSLLNRPSWPPNDPISQGTELNWDIFLVQLYINVHNFEMVSSNTSVSGLYLSCLVKYLCTCLALPSTSVPVWPHQTPLYLSGLVKHLFTCLALSNASVPVWPHETPL